MIQNPKIDGHILKKMMLAAAQNLERTKEEINAINVFPIPDGDTGVNLFLTIRKVVEDEAAAMTGLKRIPKNG